MRVVFAGCGFLGESAAGLFFREGWEVLGICRTEETARRLDRRPYAVRAIDISVRMGVLEGWQGADALVHCASSGRGGELEYRAVYRDGLVNLLEAISPQRVIFTGSTSVYGQVDGGEVTEISPAEPQVGTAKVLLEAEAVALQAGGVVARLSGLYGPGRSHFLKKFLDGTATLEAGGDRVVNQIHRDDAARAILRLAGSDVPAGIYNVSDDQPATQREIYAWLAEYFGRPMPAFSDVVKVSKRGVTNKRVSNGKMRSLGWLPEYSSFREAVSGLTGSIE